MMDFLDKPLGIIVSTITILSALIGSHIWAYKFGVRKANKDFKLKSIENRYVLIYAPLRKLLLDKHRTSAVAILYPKFTQRFKRAKPYIQLLNLKMAYKRLTDKYGSKPSTEIEYGGMLELEEMKQIVSDNIMWADKKLVSLLQRADRSGYEQYFTERHKYDTMLTEEENELFDYIIDKYNELNKRLISK